MYCEQVAAFLSRALGPFYALLALAWLGLVPAGLVVAAVRAWGRDPRSTRSGLLLGLGVAAWASGSWLGIPYVGAYPNLPGLLLAAPFFEPGTAGQEWVVHLFNVTVWPVVGMAAFHAGRAAARPPGPAGGV